VHWPEEPPEFNPLVSLAQQEANEANLLRGWMILSEARKVSLHVHELVALRISMNSFVSLYPAATELRIKLGSWICTYLEKYRGAVTYLAFSTLREKRTAGNDLPTKLKAFLNENTSHMETYIRTRYGERAFNTFRRFQNSLVEVIEGERRQGIEVQRGRPMKFLMRMFRRQPIFWLMHNLNFPVEGRMTWDQVSMWAIQRLRKRGDNIEPPTWPIELRSLDGWNQLQDATGIWNEAVIEVYTDIRRRFCTLESLHLAV